MNIISKSFALVCITILFLSSKNMNKEGDIPVISITTDFGIIKLILFDETPKHKENFIKLVKEGFYDGTTFHRIIPKFMIQGGDINSKDSIPGNDGQGELPYRIPAEIVPGMKHSRGMVAGARLPDQINPQRESSACQFYIVQNPEGTSWLDGQYSIFGKVIQGMDVVDKIVSQPQDQRNRPLKDIRMKMTMEMMSKKNFDKVFGTVLGKGIQK